MKTGRSLESFSRRSIILPWGVVGDHDNTSEIRCPQSTRPAGGGDEAARAVSSAPGLGLAFQDARRLVHPGNQLPTLLGPGEGQHFATVVLDIPQPAAED